MAIVDIQGSLRRCGFRRNRGVNTDGGVVSRTVAGETGRAEPEGIVTLNLEHGVVVCRDVNVGTTLPEFTTFTENCRVGISDWQTAETTNSFNALIYGFFFDCLLSF